MSKALLGDEIDIHGGGMDLIFPHHENETAQSEAASGKNYVRYWLHNNMFTFKGSKMSKSLGNIQTMRHFLEEWGAEVFKYMVLSVHYRSEAEFSQVTIDHAVAGLGRIYSALKKSKDYGAKIQSQDSEENFSPKIKKALMGGESLVEEPFNCPEIQQFKDQIGRVEREKVELFNNDFANPPSSGPAF